MIGHLGIETLDILSKSIQQSTTTGSIVESKRGKQDSLKHTCLSVVIRKIGRETYWHVACY